MMSQFLKEQKEITNTLGKDPSHIMNQRFGTNFLNPREETITPVYKRKLKTYV